MYSTTNNTERSDQRTSSLNKINIWQQNVNRSPICQHALISSAALARKGINVVALQEPAINSFGTTVAAREWTVVYPSTHNAKPTKTRSLILLRSNILTDKWKQIDFPSGDVTIITISGSWGELTISNIYNDCEHNNTIHELETFARTRAFTMNANANNAPPPDQYSGSVTLIGTTPTGTTPQTPDSSQGKPYKTPKF